MLSASSANENGLVPHEEDPRADREGAARRCRLGDAHARQVRLPGAVHPLVLVLATTSWRWTGSWPRW